jgi:hypothetical protein
MMRFGCRLAGKTTECFASVVLKDALDADQRRTIFRILLLIGIGFGLVNIQNDSHRGFAAMFEIDNDQHRSGCDGVDGATAHRVKMLCADRVEQKAQRAALGASHH